MPYISKKQDLNNWKARMAVSHNKYRELEKEVKEYREYYKGNQTWGGGLDNGLDQVVDNMVFSNIRAIIPRLNHRNPRIYVSPKKKPYRTENGIFDTVASAIQFEVMMNYYFHEIQTKREARLCLYDALIGHYGIMEIGYTLQTEKFDSKDGDLLNVDEIIKGESVFTKRRSPRDFRCDPEGIDHLLNDSRWVALRFVRELDDLKEDGRFDMKGVKPNYFVNTDPNKHQDQQSRENMDLQSGDADANLWARVEGWDLYDKKTKRVLTLVDNHDKWLRNDKWGLNYEGFPVELLYFNENPDEQVPIPDIAIYQKAQDEVNWLGSLQMSHARRISERRYVMNEQALSDPTEEMKLQYGRDGTVIKVKGNPNDKIIPLQDATISSDIWMLQRLKKQEISEMSGVSPMDRNQSMKFDTATEPMLMQQGNQGIRDDQRMLFEDFLTRTIRKMSMVIQQTSDTQQSIPMSDEMVAGLESKMRNPNITQQTRQNVVSKMAKIVGPEGQIILQPWMDLSPEDLQGEYEFKIEIGSTAPVNQQTRKQDMMTLAQVLAGDPYVRQREARIKLLEAFDIKDANELLKSEEEVQKMQQAMMQSQQQGEMQEREMKSKTDLTKTQMKVASADKKTESNLLAEVLKLSKQPDGGKDNGTTSRKK